MVAAVLAGLLLMALVSSLRFGVSAVPFGPTLAATFGDWLAIGDLQLAPGIMLDSPEAGLRLAHGVVSGDLNPTSAVVWAAASAPSEMIVEFWEEATFETAATRSRHSGALLERDFATAFWLEGLTPDTAYTYRVSAEATDRTGSLERSDSATGRFRTAPDSSTHRDFSFVFSGDLGGGGYCRRADSGYRIFDAMGHLQPDFFIAAGDMIYADNTCPATNPEGQPDIQGSFGSVAARSVDWSNYEQVRGAYFRHWRYNRADLPFQRFLRDTPMYVLWDDHEIINDGGASWSYWNATSANRAGYPTLASAARDAFFAYAPLARDPGDPNRIYRRFSWGADADLFLLDTRSYRSRNDLADSPENQKTMLGRQQLEWLKTGLVQSTATWKIVASSVPLSIPTGGLAAAIIGRDGWANGTSWDYSSQTGFERELLDLLRSVDDAVVRNVVFLSGDAHQAVEIRYEADVNGKGRPLIFHEIVAGPLSAPTTRDNPQLDPTLSPTQLYREAGFFNFGYVRIERGVDGLAHFIVDIRDADGQARTGSRLDLVPAR